MPDKTIVDGNERYLIGDRGELARAIDAEKRELAAASVAGRASAEMPADLAGDEAGSNDYVDDALPPVMRPAPALRVNTGVPAPVNEYDLKPGEIKALVTAGNDEAFNRSRLLDRRISLMDEIAMIDKTLAHLKGKLEGAFKAILLSRELEGDWNFDQATGKITRQLSAVPGGARRG
jgi:hypothetical protein